MKTPSVSFGSLMIIRMNKIGNQLPIKDEIGLAFPDTNGEGGNSELKGYYLSDTFHHEQKPDGTVHNAAKNFAQRLDDEYRRKKGLFKENPKRVIFTEADFYVNPKRTEKRYFLTAASEADEEKIHNILSQSTRYLVAKWGR